jgi:hypothetical protein
VIAPQSRKLPGFVACGPLVRALRLTGVDKSDITTALKDARLRM